jgi:hypothetical protein
VGQILHGFSRTEIFGTKLPGFTTETRTYYWSSLVSNFLQVFNEQINDLLDPSQRNLQVYILTQESCTEVCNCTTLYGYLIDLHSFIDKRNDWQWYPCWELDWRVCVNGWRCKSDPDEGTSIMTSDSCCPLYDYW